MVYWALPGLPLNEVRCFNGCCGAHPSGGDDLAEVGIGCFPRRKHSRDTGVHVIVHLDITFFHLNLSLKYLRIRRMAYKNEYSVSGKEALFPCLDVSCPDRLDILFANDLGYDGVPDKFHFWMFEGSFLQHCPRPQTIPSMEYRHRAGIARQEKPFLQRRVPRLQRQPFFL